MELPKLELFNAFETENADVWIKRYELMCEFSKWDDVQATRAFTCFIDNYALAWYMLLDDEDRNSKDKLFRKFKDRFGRNCMQKVGFWKEAANLKQKDEETVSQFISRQVKPVFMERFIYQGLRPEFVVPFVTANGLKQKFTISEAIDAALLADMTIQLKSKSEPDQVTSAIKDNPTPQNQPISDLLGVRGVNDNFIRVLGKVTLPVEIGKLTLFHDFYILDDVNMPLILGRDFMHDQKAEISFPKQVLSLQNGMTEVSLSQGQDRDHTHNFVRVLSDVTFQPRQRVIFPVKIDNFSENTSGVIEPNFSLAGKHNIMGARCLITNT
ncbi:Hypothetical predicted protein [Mytilus galloprovincialis]|uniref:Retrotransposon gag domain-containing protein n=1 Tax=Mytilus galloprovincialis TaxID=29158 RepID=A0A8B6DSW0_MYTGA|nr:Hypothetical predicted protein [Mytilus galloprovincialis]